jgi:hypothetical protein
MTRYTATISHHSISRARVINAGDTLTAAKRNASREFNGEFLDYEILIADSNDEIVARRRVKDRKWEDTPNG